jgi:hypothetical protein
MPFFKAQNQNSPLPQLEPRLAERVGASKHESGGAMNPSKLSNKELWQASRNAPGTGVAWLSRRELQRRWTASQRPVSEQYQPILAVDLPERYRNQIEKGA